MNNDSLNSGVSLEGNGTGYEGKLELIAPNSVAPGSRIQVQVKGGTSPYNLTASNSGVVITELQLGYYQLDIPNSSQNFQFSLEVTDSQNAQVIKSISVIGGSNYYSLVSATSFLMLENKSIAYDSRTKKLMSFDSDGKLGDYIISMDSNDPQRIAPYYFDFISEIKVTSDHTYALNVPNQNIFAFQANGLSPIGLVDLAMANIEKPIAIATNDTHLFVIDANDNSISRFLGPNSFVDKIQINNLTSTAEIIDLAIAPNGDVYLLDAQLQKIIILNSQLNLVREISLPNNTGLPAFFYEIEISPVDPKIYLSQIASGSTYAQPFSQHFGETILRGDSIRSLYTIDGENNGSAVLRELLIYNLWPNQPISFCLDPQPDGSVIYCDWQNQLIRLDSDGNIIEQLSSLALSDNVLPMPSAIAVTDEGNIFAISGLNNIRVFDSDQNLLRTRVDVFGLFPDFYDLTTMGNTVVVGSAFGYIYYLDGSTGDQQRYIFLSVNNQEITPKRVVVHNDELYILSPEFGLSKFDLDGNFLGHHPFSRKLFLNEIVNPENFSGFDFEITSSGKIFVTSYSEKKIYVANDFSSNFSIYSRDTEPGWIHGIDNDTVYIVNMHDNEVFQFNENIGATTLFGGIGTYADKFVSPAGIIYKNGLFYAADAAKNSVVIVPWSL